MGWSWVGSGGSGLNLRGTPYARYFTSNALYIRYSKERTSHRLAKIRSSVDMAVGARQAQVEELSKSSAISDSEKKEIATVATILSDRIADSEKLSFLLEDPDRVDVLVLWFPTHEWRFLKQAVYERLYLSTRCSLAGKGECGGGI